MDLLSATESVVEAAEMVGVVNPVLIIPVFAFTYITVSALKIRQRMPHDKNWVIPLINVAISVLLTMLVMDTFTIGLLLKSSIPLAGVTSITYDLFKNAGRRANKLILKKIGSLLDRKEGEGHE